MCPLMNLEVLRWINIYCILICKINQLSNILYSVGRHTRATVIEFAKMTIDITNELDDKAKKDQYDRANSQEKRVIHDCRSKCSHSQADNMKKKEVTKLAHK
jgi:hypothetical protein